MADADPIHPHPQPPSSSRGSADGSTNTPRPFSVSASGEEIQSAFKKKQPRRSRHDSQDSQDIPHQLGHQTTESPGPEGTGQSSGEEQESSSKEEEQKSVQGKPLHSDRDGKKDHKEPKPLDQDQQSQKNKLEKNSFHGEFSPDEQQVDVVLQKKLYSSEEKELQLPGVVIQKSSSDDLTTEELAGAKEQPQQQQREGEDKEQHQQLPGQTGQGPAQVQLPPPLHGGQLIAGPMGAPQSQGRQQSQWMFCIAFLAISFGLFGTYFYAEDFGDVDVHVLEQLAEAWRPSNCVNVLVTGRATTGKHELVNALLGVKPKCASTSLQRVPVCEANVQGTCFKVTFWTLPDVNDWNAMEKQLRTLDLVVYALRMDDTRLRPEDISNLYTLSKEFGHALWTKGMFALTFANKVTYLDHEHRVRRSRDFSMHRRNELKQRIRDILLSANVLEDVSKNIPFVPTGHHSEMLLFDDEWEPWINQFTKCAIVKMYAGNSASSGGSAASGALWKVAKHHLKLDSDMTVVRCPQIQ